MSALFGNAPRHGFFCSFLIFVGGAYSLPWYQDGLLLFLLATGGILVSAIGVFFSWRAFRAASKAGHVVKLQDILLEVTELSEKCHLNLNVSFEEVSEVINVLSSRTTRVTTVFKELINQSDPKLIPDLNTAFDSARTKLNSLNPVINPAVSTAESPLVSIIYYTMETELSSIRQKLNMLKAVLEKAAAEGGPK